MGTVFNIDLKKDIASQLLTTLIHDLWSKVHKLKKCIPPVKLYVTAVAKPVKQTFITKESGGSIRDCRSAFVIDFQNMFYHLLMEKMSISF